MCRAEGLVSFQCVEPSILEMNNIELGFINLLIYILYCPYSQVIARKLEVFIAS